MWYTTKLSLNFLFQIGWTINFTNEGHSVSICSIFSRSTTRKSMECFQNIHRGWRKGILSLDMTYWLECWLIDWIGNQVTKSISNEFEYKLQYDMVMAEYNASPDVWKPVRENKKHKIQVFKRKIEVHCVSTVNPLSPLLLYFTVLPGWLLCVCRVHLYVCSKLWAG